MNKQFTFILLLAIICIAVASPAVRVLQSGYNCDPNVETCPCDPTTQDCSCWNCILVDNDLKCFYIC
ncbi:transmembrane protein, putative (macronuclear) [Tetrahymena thermophila SB210]|uniref:Transmembrane protein, putative n=1 Tax=Tetrahymena thermophila (strain SB210) TaxID=312017 RepID=W7XED3_TETTS|nr:transmembrane protein, putative [Tetrahymena thermophila SB210]EWS71244.1 transmembrane protein, putative [Tetrahymena thermophila SB210]|eukprot:XP_012656217.1 transmembrane protein, putative [Tetrahymena thermophila SB210]